LGESIPCIPTKQSLTSRPAPVCGPPSSLAIGLHTVTNGPDDTATERAATNRAPRAASYCAQHAPRLPQRTRSTSGDVKRKETICGQTSCHCVDCQRSDHHDPARRSKIHSCAGCASPCTRSTSSTCAARPSLLLRSCACLRLCAWPPVLRRSRRASHQPARLPPHSRPPRHPGRRRLCRTDSASPIPNLSLRSTCPARCEPTRTRSRSRARRTP
jgi:hypothetical protein